MSKNVCFLSTEHPFLDARIFKKEAKSLSKRGYNVTMIVPRKNGFLFGVDGRIFHNTFRSSTFVHEGITIMTYEQVLYENFLKILHRNLMFAGLCQCTDRLIEIGITVAADIYHAHEFFSLYAGVCIKRALRAKGKDCKLIYDSHELEPDPLAKEAPKTKKLKEEMLISMLNETDHVITVSESIKSTYKALQPTLPVDVIYNSPPLARNYTEGKGQQTGLTLVYEGMIDAKRGSFNKLIDIVQRANKYFDLNVRIIGGRKKYNEQHFFIPPQVEDKFQMSGWVSYESIPQAMEGVDLGWIDLDAAHSLNNRFAMPNKFFSYLNNGIPIVVNQCDDMAAFIQQYTCGYVVKKRVANATDYVQALLRLHANREQISHMSKNARHMMETMYSWEQMEKRLFHVYKRLYA